MRQPLILGIVGEKSSGKSNVFTYLAKKPGVFSARTSDVLKDVLTRLHLDTASRPNNAKLAEALRTTFGAGILPEALLADAGKRQFRLIALEGLRRLAEVKAIKRHPHFRLLYITAPVELRWQ